MTGAAPVAAVAEMVQGEDDLPEWRQFDRGERDRAGRTSPEIPGTSRILGPRYPRSAKRVLP